MKIVFSCEKTYNMEKTTVITTRQELFILEDSLYQHTTLTNRMVLIENDVHEEAPPERFRTT